MLNLNVFCPKRREKEKNTHVGPEKDAHI